MAGAADMARTPICGDEVVQPGEECDDGDGNRDLPSAAATCTSACRRRAPCGSLAGANAAVVDPTTGRCYVAWPGPLPFIAAESDCQTRGGHLVSVTSAQKNALVEMLADLPDPSERWIGLYGAQLDQWLSGEPLSFGGFATGEPDGNGPCVVDAPATGGWDDRACGWPATGNLPASPVEAHGYVCEHACGNGTVDPGEECDPPGPTCTGTCRRTRACLEPGGVTSPSGRCYFTTQSATSFADATCPMGTHLAEPNDPAETNAAIGAAVGDAWIGARTDADGVFQFSGSERLDLRRYHGFVGQDPNLAPPACVVATRGNAEGDGWRDRDCGDLYPAVCVRD
jgi:hypothetical protein